MEIYQDYLFLLEPSDTVKQQIGHCKLKASDHIGIYPGMKRRAHISVINVVRQKPFFIKGFIDNIRSNIESMPEVTIEVEGFDFFVHGAVSATIYASIKPTYRTDNWFKLLREQLKMKRDFTPHITITKAIPFDDFYKLWPELRGLKYADSFTADRLTVLAKNSLKPHSIYEHIEDIYFKNKLKT
jgi:2'-5' RNA ligase